MNLKPVRCWHNETSLPFCHDSCSLAWVDGVGEAYGCNGRYRERAQYLPAGPKDRDEEPSHEQIRHLTCRTARRRPSGRVIYNQRVRGHRRLSADEKGPTDPGLWQEATCAPSRGHPKRGGSFGSTFLGSWLNRAASDGLDGSIEPEDPVIDRRTFLAGTGAVLLAAPLAAEAQPAGKVPRVGYLSSGSSSDLARQRRFEAFRHGLLDLGYVEGRNVALEPRWAGAYDEYPRPRGRANPFEGGRYRSVGWVSDAGRPTSDQDNPDRHVGRH
jgi:hypothetical protein